MKFVRLRHCASIVAPFALFAVALFAMSLVPSPREQQSAEANSQSNQTLTFLVPPSLQITIGPPEQPENTNRKSSRDHDWTDPSVLVNIALVICAIWAGCIALGTLSAIKQEVGETKKAADASELSAKAAADSASAAADTLATNKEIERAYVKMSHSDIYLTFWPDNQGGQDSARPQSVALTVHIKNVGKTPGDFLGGFFGYHIGPTLTLPDITRTINPLTAAFLSHGDHVEFGYEISAAQEPLLPSILLDKGTNHLWLVAQVDYCDRFKQLHTSGYARCFARTGRRDIPTFVFNNQTGPLNYDRPMDKAKRRHYYGESEKPQEAHS